MDHNSQIAVWIDNSRIDPPKFWCYFEFLGQFNIGCIYHFSKRCWWFWDSAQNMLIFGLGCCTPQPVITTYMMILLLHWDTGSGESCITYLLSALPVHKMSAEGTVYMNSVAVVQHRIACKMLMQSSTGNSRVHLDLLSLIFIQCYRFKYDLINLV